MMGVRFAMDAQTAFLRSLGVEIFESGHRRWPEAVKAQAVAETLETWATVDLRPDFPPAFGRVRRLLHCYPALDRRKVDFPASFTMTGWLRHRDNAGQSGRCIRSRCGA